MSEESLTASQSNGRRITATGIAVVVGFVAQIAIAGMQWQSQRDTTASSVARIEKLEGMKADATAALVAAQSIQIERVFNIVTVDHDSIVRLQAILENQSKIDNRASR